MIRLSRDITETVVASLQQRTMQEGADTRTHRQADAQTDTDRQPAIHTDRHTHAAAPYA